MDRFRAGYQALLKLTDIGGSALVLTLPLEQPANHRNDDDADQRDGCHAEFRV